MTLNAETQAAVRAFAVQGDGEAEKSKDLTLALLEWAPEPFARTTYTPGHITCTGCVLSPDQARVLLVRHKRLDRWLLPGGHVEPDDARIADAAVREVLEETGIIVLPSTPRLAGIDVHPIPSNGREPLHLHHDLIWGFVASNEETRCSEESRAVAWCEFDEFDRFELPGSIRRAALRLAGRRSA